MKTRTYTISFDVVVRSEKSDDDVVEALTKGFAEIIDEVDADGLVDKYVEVDVTDIVNFGAERAE